MAGLGILFSFPISKNTVTFSCLILAALPHRTFQRSIALHEKVEHRLQTYIGLSFVHVRVASGSTRDSLLEVVADPFVCEWEGREGGGWCFRLRFGPG